MRGACACLGPQMPGVQVAKALRQQGLTLQNYASIREQTIGGFTQVC